MNKSNFIEIINHLYKGLNNNERVKGIFNTALNNTTLLDLQKKFGIDLLLINKNHMLYNLFKIVDYLKECIIKNDENNGNVANIESDIFDLNEMMPNDLLAIDIELDINEKYLLLKTLTMLLSYSISTTVTKNISKFIDNKLNVIYQVNNKFTIYYRGHSDASYKLIPSMYRNYSINTLPDCLINKDKIFNMYHDVTLIRKYDNIFGFKSVDYDFCSYMQHATSYSPLLDLTSDYKIALSFATYKNSNIAKHTKTNAALYKFSFKNESIKVGKNEDINDINVFIFPNKMWLNTIYNNQRIYYLLPKDFDPEILIFNEKNNDRMLYQKGSFLFFKKCVIVNGNILLPYKLGNIIKYVIPSSKSKMLYKDYIYEIIKQKFPQYQYDYLMDPYKYFDEKPLI